MFGSLRWRIMIAFGLVIILAVFFIAIVAFAATRFQFNTLLLEEGRAEAAFIGAYVESQYNLNGGWDGVQIQLPDFDFEAVPDFFLEAEDTYEEEAYWEWEWDIVIADTLNLSWVAYEQARQQVTIAELAEARDIDLGVLIRAIIRAELEYVSDISEQALRLWVVDILSDVEFYIYDDFFINDNNLEIDSFSESFPIYAPFGAKQVLVTDAASVVILDSKGNLEGEPLPLSLQKSSAPIYDWQTNTQIGSVAVATGEGFYYEQENEFLSDVSFFLFSGGFLAIVVALGVGAIFAQQITAPVTALTKAATHLAESGQTEHLPIASTDELGQMSQAFNQMTDALQAQRTLRQRLITDVSHEINTPLSVIQLEAKGLRDGLQTPQEAASQILQKITLLHNLVQDLNWLAETDQGNIVLSPEPTDFKGLLTEITARWQPKAELEGILLRLMPLPNLPILNLDPQRINQIMDNLIGNAFQYTPKAGQITISLKHGSISAEAGRWAIMSVRDTGTGIPPDDLSYIFERFYRADRARQQREGGRGLGLSIVKQLVVLHGGHVWVESEVGQGSCFYVALKVQGD